MQKSILKRPEFVIPALMVFAALFSVFFMLPQSLGLDEAQTLWQAAHSFPNGILYVVAQDVHVPLYHFLLHFWEVAFGNSAAAARVLPLIFYLATIPLVYKLGRTAFDESTALFGAALFALSPFANWYGSIIRMYSMLAFFSVLNQIFFVLIYKGDPANRKKYWVGYFLSALFGMYTHYFFLFIPAVQFIFFFAYRKLFPAGALRRFMIIAGALIILLAPWLMYVRSVGGFGTNTTPQLLAPSTVDVANTFSNFFFGFQVNSINTVILSLWPIATLLFMLALQKNRRVTPEATYFMASTFAPILGAALLSNLVIPFYLSRYFIGIFPSCCLVASWLFSLYPRTASLVTRTALAAAMVVMLKVQTGTASAASPIQEDYRAAADYVAANATARDIVVVSTPFTVYPFEYYYHGDAAVTTIPAWNRLVSGPIPAYTSSTAATDLSALKSDHQYLWLIVSYDQGYEQQLKTYLDTHFERVEAKDISPGIGLSLYVYRLNYHNATLSDAIGIANGVPRQ